MGFYLLAGFACIFGLLLLFGGALALWRLLPRASRVEDTYDMLVRMDALERQFVDFARKYEIAVRSFRTQKSRLTSQLRDAGEEPEEEIPQEEGLAGTPANVAPPQDYLSFKQELRRRAGLA